MRVVQNILTGRLVYRESPDFRTGNGLKNAILLGLGKPDDLIEIQVSEDLWEAELALQAQESAPTLQETIDLLTLRIANIEKVILKM